MKKMKLIPLLACLLFLLGFTASAQNNTFSRSTCNPYFQGCSNEPLELILSTQHPNGFNISNSKSVNAPSSGVTFGADFTKVDVYIDGYTSTAPYYLPTTIGESTIISLGANGEGVGPYTVGIYKSGNNQFIVSVGYMAY